MSDDVELFGRVYEPFNRRDIEGVLEAMHPDVVCANGMEGGHVHGRDGVRAIGNANGQSSIRMWSPFEIPLNGEGESVVKVHQVVRDPKGNLLAEKVVIHVFQIQNALIRRFDIRDV
jgi:hypothetical protein